MIRDYGSLVALDVAYTLVGAAWLRPLGIGRGIRAVGLAFTLGWISIAVLHAIVLPLGVPFDRWEVAAALVAVAAAGLVAGRRLPGGAEPGRRAAGSPLVARASTALVAAYLALLAVRSIPGEADTNWDAWAFWLPKARSLYWFRGLDNGPGGFTHFANRDYPPLGPALDATSYSAMGSTASAPLGFQHWLILAGFVAALARLLAPRVRGDVLWPCLAALVLMPKVGFFAGSSLADETLGILVALCAVAAALWLLDPTVPNASLFVLFATAAALLKNEGVIYGLSLSLVVAVVALRRGSRVTAALVVLAPLVALVPWKVWLLVNHLPFGSQYYGPGDLAPGHLVASANRLPTTVAHLGWYLLSPNRWLLAVPLALAAAALVARRRPQLLALTLSFVGLSVSGLVVIYWIGNVPIAWWLVTSGDRLVMAIAMGCAALLPLLATEAAADP